MRWIVLSIGLFFVTGCGSGSPETPADTAGVPLSIKSPVEAENVGGNKPATLPEAMANPAVEQLVAKAKAGIVGGKAPIAVEALSQAIGIDPKDPTLFRMRADVYALIGEFANARADFSLAIQADPNNAELHNVRGYFLMTRGATNDALNDFNKALELNPSLAAAWNNRGLIHLSANNYDAAEADFVKATELDRKYVDAVNNLGFVRMKAGKLDQSLSDLQQAVKLNPKYTTAWNNLGLVNMQKENYDAAVEAFSKAIELAPLDVRWRNHRRAAYLKLERFEEATADGNRVAWLTGLAQLTNHAAQKSNDANAWIQRARHLTSGSEFGAAVQDYSRALSLDPANLAALNGRAYAWFQTGELQKAIADCDQSLVVEPSANAFSVRGDAWLALKNFDQAVKDFEAANRFDEVVAEAYKGRAEQRKAAGQTQLAQEDLKKAQQILSGVAGQSDSHETAAKPVPFPAQ
ncbi:tetratricopeptide repeat protein [Fuerstiella marisgermanici]|uniref:Lipoprotein n=1 Tax=Fuerstiella marisgermanici TaxID=1891926 RepID=A0A1P8WF09_9PLAN|nr:tetratricopeptide repeat protein [Fuerstiella marisgermanici]APZ92621.1 lipoprotein [Fuerstiella marisgermanici]